MIPNPTTSIFEAMKLKPLLQQAAITVWVILILAACSSDPKPVVPPYDGVSVLRIQTAGQDIGYETKIPATMSIYQDDELVQDLTIGIEIRGATSAGFEKRSYSIELRDAVGNDLPAKVLDMPEESDWILYAPYSDKTFLNNHLAYDWSNRIGQYAARTAWVELEVNGQYEGVYLFMERIKRDPQRVDIKKLGALDNSTDLITGGYILKIDKAVGEAPNIGWPDATYLPDYSFRSDYGASGLFLAYPAFNGKQSEETYFIYSYPKPEDITAQQKTYIQGYMRQFETALVEETFSGNSRSYTAYIDVPSFVDHFILNEITGNPDAYRLSTFLHKDRGGKLRMGPVWDFNIGFGNDGRSQTQQWIYQFNRFYGGDLWLVPFWWEKLLADPQFRAAVKKRWTELRQDVFKTENVLKQIDDEVAFLKAKGVVDRNYARWPVLGVPLPFNSVVWATYDEEVQYLKDWLTDRVTWMDQQILAW